MSKADRATVDALRAVTSFDEPTAHALATHGTVVNVPARWSLMFENTPADKAYVLLEGTVVIRRDGADVAELGPGAVIGEMALLNRQLRNASVFATTDIKALHFTEEAIHALAAENSAFADTLRTAAEERLAR